LPDRDCPGCGGAAPAGSRFCPHCGTRLDGTSDTAVIQPPPDETGPVPVRRAAVEPHLFGVTPPMALFALGLAAVAVAILLLAVGTPAAGLILLAVGLLLLVAFVRVARRKPDSELARRSTAAVDGARDRVSVVLGTAATRSRARRRVASLRAQLLRLGERRRALLLDLGRAVYEGDDAATHSLRTELAELDRAAADKEAEVSAIVEQARREIARTRLEVQPTEMVEMPGSPGEAQPAGPAVVPEPYPPPDEGTPPQPVPTPEPYPPPDEGDPPQPQ